MMNRFLSFSFALSLLTGGLKSEMAPSVRISEGRFIAASRLGVKIYSPSRILKIQDPDEIDSADLATLDAPEKVIKFYEKELRATSDADGMIMARKDGRTYLVRAMREGTVTLVWIMGQRWH